jgi:hypothetical protein
VLIFTSDSPPLLSTNPSLHIPPSLPLLLLSLRMTYPSFCPYSLTKEVFLPPVIPLCLSQDILDSSSISKPMFSLIVNSHSSYSGTLTHGFHPRACLFSTAVPLLGELNLGCLNSEKGGFSWKRESFPGVGAMTSWETGRTGAQEAEPQSRRS